MSKKSTKNEQQRRTLRDFLHASRMRNQQETAAEELRTHALSAVTKENESAKDELSKLINSVDADRIEAHAALEAANLSQFANFQPGKIKDSPGTEHPRIQLERAVPTVREKKELLRRSVALLEKHRANVRRRRPIACCMVFVGVPTIVILILVAFFVPQLRNLAIIKTVVPIFTSVSVTDQIHSAPSDLLDAIKQRGYILVSTNPNSEPQSFLNVQGKRASSTKCPFDALTAHEMIGFDVDVAVAIGQALNVETCFVTPSWNEVTSGNWHDKWDISVSSVDITTELQSRLFFTTAYYYKPAVVALSKNSKISSLDQLGGKGLCVGMNTIYEDWLRGRSKIPSEEIFYQLPSDISIVTRGSDEECAYTIQAGNQDLNGFVGYLSSVYSIDSHISHGLPVKKLGEPVFLESFAVAIDKLHSLSCTSLIARLDQIIQEMRQSGKLSELSTKWFAADLTSYSQSATSNRSAKIRSAKISSEVEEVNLRHSPGYLNKNEYTDVIIKIPKGSIVEILDGPIEKDGLTWWKVSWNGDIGWIADHTGQGRTIMIFDKK